MPTENETIARDFAVPHMANVFGRNIDEPIKYFPPSPATPVALPRAIVFAIEFTDEVNPETASVVRNERRTVSVPKDVMDDLGITGYQHSAQVEIDGEKWHVDAGTSNWDDNSLIKLGLVRKPLARMQEARGGSV